MVAGSGQPSIQQVLRRPMPGVGVMSRWEEDPAMLVRAWHALPQLPAHTERPGRRAGYGKVLSGQSWK
jgi:hypothetical protein